MRPPDGLLVTRNRPEPGARSATSSGAPLTLDHLSKNYGGVRVLDDVSLDVRRGEFFTLLGPSGAGKSTILGCIAGLEHPDAGSIRLGADDITDVPSNLRGVGMVFQNYALFPSMTVRQNVAFPLEARTQRGVLDILRASLIRREQPDIRRRVDAALELVKLSGHADKWPHQLSGGEQQRVALARALVGEPRVLCFDEPLSSLDEQLRRELQEQIRTVHERLGATTLYVTHDQAEAFALSDRIAVVHRGRVLQVGSPEDLYERPTSMFVAMFLGECNILDVQEVERSGDVYGVTLHGGLRLRLLQPVSQEHHALGVRPEHVFTEVCASGAHGDATVTGTSFAGSHVRIALELARGRRLTALVPSHLPVARSPVGTSMRLSFRPEYVLVLPKAREQTAADDESTPSRSSP